MKNNVHSLPFNSFSWSRLATPPRKYPGRTLHLSKVKLGITSQTWVILSIKKWFTSQVPMCYKSINLWELTTQTDLPQGLGVCVRECTTSKLLFLSFRIAWRQRDKQWVSNLPQWISIRPAGLLLCHEKYQDLHSTWTATQLLQTTGVTEEPNQGEPRNNMTAFGSLKEKLVKYGQNSKVAPKL